MIVNYQNDIMLQAQLLAFMHSLPNIPKIVYFINISSLYSCGKSGNEKLENLPYYHLTSLNL